MMEARKQDLLFGPQPLPSPMDLSLLREIIGFFGHENRQELWVGKGTMRFKYRPFFLWRKAMLIFPQWRPRQGFGLALVQKMHKGVPCLWVYRCEDSLMTNLSPYFTLLAERDYATELMETQQIREIIHHSVREYFDPEF